MSFYKYAQTHKQLLEQLPGGVSLIGLDYKIVWLNERARHSFGFGSNSEAIGKSYFELQAKAAEKALKFEANDQIVFDKQEQCTFLGYNEFADGWRLTICEKSPVFDEQGSLLGLITYWTDVTNYALIDISRFILGSSKRLGVDKKPFSYFLQDAFSNYYQLSQRQLECLFFLLRGKTDKQVAGILNISPRTVESYINEIKHKMNCFTREEIVEKGFSEGLLNIFPRSLLKN